MGNAAGWMPSGVVTPCEVYYGKLTDQFGGQWMFNCRQR
jgi:hypothetical protein